MGDLQDWSADQNLGVIKADCFDIAEQATQEILAQVQATLVSEKRRNDVIVFVQKLIRDSLGCEVFQFGSVPLKTYLPDGDIDLTAFGSLNLEDALANDVYTVLEREEQNASGKFMVKDVQLVPAEVKLVKCLVQNIVVDISFNQLGGLCTLCFLEQVDRLIGKSNLFKRSIVLIKAWCYYESRILGAHHGLISTYALETLVLYIFHLFHSSLNGPLGVLYKFLEYFSKFDWDNYCISLNGPICISSLPKLVAVAPENDGGELLFSDAFLKDCMDMFADSSRVSETTSRGFPVKHLNVVDPLRETNNLGRSVSKGNFYRVQCALNFGARKLGQILSLPEESIATEIRSFFSNTLDRHDNDTRPDVQELSSSLEDNLSSELGSSDYLEESSCKEMELGTPRLMDVESHANMTDVSEFSGSNNVKGLIAPSVQDLTIITDEMYKPCHTYSEVEVSYDEKDRMRDNHKTETVVVSKSHLSDPSSLDALAVEFDPDYRKNRDTFDFSGEFVNHLNNLQSGRWLYNCALNASTQWSPRLSSQGMLSHSANSYFPQTAFYLPVSFGFISGTAFAKESKPKTRGTGTYFPNANHYRDNKAFNQRTRNQTHARSPRYNGHGAMSPGRMAFSSANGEVVPPEYGEEYVLPDNPLPYITSFDQNSNLSLPISVPVPQAQMQTSLLDVNQDTAAKKSWRLKDVGDFPPLSIIRS